MTEIRTAESTSRKRRFGRLLGIAAAAAVAVTATAAPFAANAEDWRHDRGRGEGRRGEERREEWREHQWRAHEWREHHPYGWGWERPAYAYIPPPPVYYAPRPGVSLVVPFDLR